MTTPFWRATLTLLAGGAMAQAVPLLLGPVLARLYTPEAFGQFGVVWTLATHVAVLGCARYEFALPLEPEAHRARVLMALCLRVWLAVGAASLVVAGVLVQWRGQGLGWWLPLAVLAASASQALTLWATRAQAFSALSVARLLQYGGAAVLQVALAAVLGSAQGLLAGAVLGAAAAACWMARHSPAPGPEEGGRMRAWRGLWLVPAGELKAMAQQHRDFPRYNLPHAFVSALQDSLALLLLASWASDADAGYWALALRYLKAPASLVGGAVSQVLYPRLVGASPEAAQRLLRHTLAVLGAVGLLLAAVLLGFGPALFEWLFGPPWRAAGALAQALAPYIAFHFVASPLAVVTMAWQAQAWALRLALWGSLAFMAAFSVGLFWGGLLSAAWMVSGVMSLYFSAYFLALWRWPLHALTPGPAAALAAGPQAGQNPGP